MHPLPSTFSKSKSSSDAPAASCWSLFAVLFSDAGCDVVVGGCGSVDMDADAGCFAMLDLPLHAGLTVSIDGRVIGVGGKVPVVVVADPMANLLSQRISLSSSRCTLVKSRKRVDMDIIGWSKHRWRYFSILSALDFLLKVSRFLIERRRVRRWIWLTGDVSAGKGTLFVDRG